MPMAARWLKPSAIILRSACGSLAVMLARTTPKRTSKSGATWPTASAILVRPSTSPITRQPVPSISSITLANLGSTSLPPRPAMHKRQRRLRANSLQLQTLTNYRSGRANPDTSTSTSTGCEKPSVTPVWLRSKPMQSQLATLALRGTCMAMLAAGTGVVVSAIHRRANVRTLERHLAQASKPSSTSFATATVVSLLRRRPHQRLQVARRCSAWTLADLPEQKC